MTSLPIFRPCCLLQDPIELYHFLCPQQSPGEKILIYANILHVGFVRKPESQNNKVVIAIVWQTDKMVMHDLWGYESQLYSSYYPFYSVSFI